MINLKSLYNKISLKTKKTFEPILRLHLCSSTKNKLSLFKLFIQLIKIRQGNHCGKCYSWISCKYPYLFGCKVTCSFSFCRFLQCRIFSILRYSVIAIGWFNRCRGPLKIFSKVVLWWLRMFKLFDKTQSVSCSPNYWHFYDRRELGSARAWFVPSRKISIALFGAYINYFNLSNFYKLYLT